MRRKRKAGRRVNATGRSEGDGQWVPLSYSLLHSPAWRSLSGAAAKVFLELRSRFNGGNNGKLILSLENAADCLGIGKATVQRALAELVAKGFVIRTRLGNWYGRLASTWAVTDKGVDGSPPTNAWKQWRPAPEKTERGSNMDPSAETTGPLQNRRPRDGTATAPVRAIGSPVIGSEMGR